MAIVIPNRDTRILQQANRSDVLGSLDRSLNLDLLSNLGRIRATRMKNVIDSNDDADIELAIAFVRYNDDYWFFTDDFAYKGDSSPSDTFTKEVGGGAPAGDLTETQSDAKVFNGKIYVTGNSEVYAYETGTGWTKPITSGLALSPHLLEVFGDKLYITNDDTTVLSINTSEVLATSGTSTLDLGLEGGFGNWSISMLKAGYDRLWIGLTNAEDGKGLMFEWDGETENTPTRRYNLDAGVVAGTVHNNIPYFVDARGRLMAYNGAAFQEVARFPKESGIQFLDATDANNTRWVHPNGIQSTTDGTIIILMQNTLDNSEYENNCPSGIWEYDPSIGLYHKYSLSYSDVGGTSVSDYGQQRLKLAGALYYAPPNNVVSTDNGILLAGCRFENDVYSVQCDDTLDTTQKYAIMETTWLQSDQVDDTWQKIFVKHKKLLENTDKYVVKYKVDYDEPTEASITWSDTSTFTTTTNLSSYVKGDEIEVVDGTGSGKTAHISSISEAGGTYTVSLDETFTGASGSSTALVSKWIKLGEMDNQNKRWEEFVIAKDSNSPQIKFKVGMQFTGKNELHELVVVNRSNTQAR